MTHDDDEYEWKVSITVPGFFVLFLIGLAVFAVVQVVR
jgi:hypothetical protein